jgi:hypothetical protein
MEEANCHVAALGDVSGVLEMEDCGGRSHLKASETQYEMKLVTPHFRAWRGTGSRSLFVLEEISTRSGGLCI